SFESFEHDEYLLFFIVRIALCVLIILYFWKFTQFSKWDLELETWAKKAKTHFSNKIAQNSKVNSVIYRKNEGVFACER
ncbi:MAG: hypothetical protein PUD50_04750, partial [Eubacteriales bacterium]|nr:hypothetical protein [Eubacteriales bacterium]